MDQFKRHRFVALIVATLRQICTASLGRELALAPVVADVRRGRPTSTRTHLVLLACMGMSLLPLANTVSASPVPATTGAVTAQAGCSPLTVAQGTSIGGYISDQYRWYDSTCKLRTAAMVRNNAQDPSGRWGGYMRQYTYDVNGTTRTVNGSSNAHPGFGYTTNHFGNEGSSAHLSNTRQGISYATLFKGANHAIHEYKYRLPLGAPVDATIHWMFATGRDHPIWAVTFDARPAGANVINADTRAPYGDIQWDGGAGAPVAGVGWGDHYKFKTVSTPMDFNSRWDYSVPNTVPYAMEWATTVDAEMGLVQTQTYLQHDAGGYWGYPLWGKNSESPGIPADVLQPGGKMPADYNWPFQLNQYEIPFQNPVTSKRVAWGSNFGAVGQTEYPSLGYERTLSGYPFQSYSVAIVLGKRTTNTVAAQVTQIETVQRTSVTSTAGTVKTSGPAGVGRSDTMTYAPRGYNPIYSTWELTADAQNTVDFTMNTSSGSLKNPIFVISNYTATTVPSTITVNGVTKNVNVDFFPSLDTAKKQLWLTYNGSQTGSLRYRIAAPAASGPTISSLLPNSAPAGGLAFTLQVSGARFVNGSTVQWNGASRPTTFVNSGRLTASISAADIATVRTASVRVVNPASSPGTSPAVSFPVAAVVDDRANTVQLEGWRGYANGSARGGSFRNAYTAGQTISYGPTPATTSLSIVTYRGPDQGQAQVLIDGVSQGILDLYNATPQWQYKKVYSGLASTAHTIIIIPLATKNPASSYTHMRFDGFEVGTTFVDNNHPAIVYGSWQGKALSSAYGASYRISTIANSTASYQFSGTQFTWITARGPNHGRAQIIVDGVVRATVDQYSPTAQWKFLRTIGGLAAGNHTVTIKVLGTKSANSTGTAIVFDGISTP